MEFLNGQSNVHLQLISSYKQAIQTEPSSMGLDSMT